MRNERVALSDNSSAALVSMLLVQYLLKEPFLVVCNSATRRYCIVLMEYCKKVDNLPWIDWPPEESFFFEWKFLLKLEVYENTTLPETRIIIAAVTRQK
jgi:hypothetical protein